MISFLHYRFHLDHYFNRKIEIWRKLSIWRYTVTLISSGDFIPVFLISCPYFWLCARIPDFMPLFLTLRPNFSVWQPVMSFNPLTPGAFCKKCVFWTFWWFSGWISAKLGWKCIRNSMPFLPLASRLQHFGSRVRRNQNIEIFEFFFRHFFYSFCFLFAAVIDLLLGLLVVKENF